MKSVPISSIFFLFPCICHNCKQEESDQKYSVTYSAQKLTVLDIQESGWPICSICDAELTVDDACTVMQVEGE